MCLLYSQHYERFITILTEYAVQKITEYRHCPYQGNENRP